MYSTPVPVAGGHVFTVLAAGLYRGCGLTPDGVAYCWGFNLFGRVGDSTTANRGVPTPVAGNHRYTAIVAGEVHTCALATDGQAWCWGNYSFGQLGTAPSEGCPVTAVTTCSSYRVPVPHGTALASLAAGRGHTCGLDRTGNGYCWGRNEDGQGGVGTTDSVLRAPTPIVMPGG
jgi:alpha-tubulin suppressor-like RCC1 family protein